MNQEIQARPAESEPASAAVTPHPSSPPSATSPAGSEPHSPHTAGPHLASPPRQLASRDALLSTSSSSRIARDLDKDASARSASARELLSSPKLASDRKGNQSREFALDTSGLANFNPIFQTMGDSNDGGSPSVSPRPAGQKSNNSSPRGTPPESRKISARGNRPRVRRCVFRLSGTVHANFSSHRCSLEPEAACLSWVMRNPRWSFCETPCGRLTWAARKKSTQL
jgi:hypothetical protein